MLLKALWGGQHRRPSIYDQHTVAGWRKEACGRRSAIAGGRNHEEMHTIYLGSLAQDGYKLRDRFGIVCLLIGDMKANSCKRQQMAGMMRRSSGVVEPKT